MDTGVQKEKEYQRAAGIARRCALSVQQRTAFDAAIADRVLALPMFAAARTILSYCAVGGEVDPAAIDAAAFRLAEGHMEAALPAAADALAPGRYGIPAPIPGRCRLLVPEDVDLVLVPCAAFDASCRRVGMGAGYYDRYLARCGAFSLALAYEAQRVPQAAAQEHDVLLGAVASENRLYWKL
mgnify:CR=1 FL=1